MSGVYEFIPKDRALEPEQLQMISNAFNLVKAHFANAKEPPKPDVIAMAILGLGFGEDHSADTLSQAAIRFLDPKAA